MENEPFERWHGAHHYSSKVHLVLVIFLILTVVSLLYFFFSVKNLDFSKVPTPSVTPKQTPTETSKPTPTGKSKDDQVVCTQDAKQCPDGSYVSRTGPNCEFAACPTQQGY